MLHLSIRVLAVSVTWLLASVTCLSQESIETLRVATYNLRNYLAMDRIVEGDFRVNYPKPESEKTVVRESILAVEPDLLAIQEIGSEELLLELRDDLANEGLVYEGYFLLEADDQTRKIGALWNGALKVRPIAHTDMSFPFFGDRKKIKRGLLELQLDDFGGEPLSLFVVHLKSRYTSDKRDPKSARRRTSEAEAARDRILERFPDPSVSRFIIMGDLNDYRHTSSVRRFLERGDVRISVIQEARDESGLIWTHFYKKGGEYSLIDYILCSPGLEDASEMKSAIYDSENYYQGSDHRLVWTELTTVQD
ncbi:endonuclease/exonuclease/phosphatase family [Verrucomicrobiia bacterium DG1235]|nr:endonuclease/exonuclease/phosphatase family [Verrucomicrobiae bacterium DG1235]